ncbi:uncharacterized protein LOC129225213 [Uloborus diversus]|uniref:uncharacterized protein LOC129225213 n=1 Tax=Uloborus diversus TaxID=327109 RepID=UPI002408F467|nr:uncharacterized protein LOC129225213 [Uloborus diversus]
MVIDRALTVRWPYRYRFSVRRNQIRYHVAVLALVSALVGVAAVFATTADESKTKTFLAQDSVLQGRLHNREFCRLHPVQWDIKFSIFLLSLFGVLIFSSIVCMIQVEVHRSRHGTKLAANGSFQLPDCASPDLPSATGMNSPLDTHSSTGSTRALHRPSRQASRRPYGKNAKGTSDLRWPSVALTALVCFSLNHIPHVVLTGLAAWSPDLWSPWHEAVLCWLGLLEGLFVPLLLFCKDSALRCALRRTFQRRSGALSPLVGDDGPFQMYFDKDHFRKRGTFGSVTPIGIITNYRRAPGTKKGRRGVKYALPGGDSVLGAKGQRFLGGGEPLSKLSCADLTSLEMWREEDEENFYATLSDDFSNFSCKSADDSALSEDMRMGEEVYGGSFTTLANDDFEFHDTRPCGGEVRMKPALVSPVQEIQRNVSFRDNIIKKEPKPENISNERERDLFLFSSKHVDDDIRKDPSLFIEPPPQWPALYDTAKNSLSSPSVEDVRNSPPANKFGSMSRHQKATSYSMNDLDLIYRGGGGGIPGHEFETTFVLPVKSESTMSLYRLNVERDLDQMAMTPSKSETNVNGDSGFGSGAQSTHPVWSGFLCRKPLDPFWNIRKPTTAAATPTRNYPGILHPRMRKIPWISAWKKLDENSDRQIKDSQLKDNPLGWVDNVVYAAEVTTSSRIIDEEQNSDVSSPLFNGDYNLNIFAKESGVLLENAYGKIVRDDCGVKVNFYGDNVQYDAKENVYGNKDNIFETSFESQNGDPNRDLFDFGKDSSKIENIYEPLNCVRSNYAGAIHSSNAYRTHTTELSEFASNSNAFKCEPRLNGGHYENLFGTKENIFAQCDLYKDKSKAEIEHPTKLERRASGRRDSGRFRSPNNACHYPEPDCGYGRLKKLEHKESFSRPRELVRKESDNRGKKCGIKRKESRNRSDKKSEIPRLKELSPPSRIPQFENKTKVPDEDSNRKRIEIELKSVYGKNDLNCNKVGKVENRDYSNLNRRESFRHHRDTSCEDSKLEHRIESNRQADKDKRIKLERKESQSRERKHKVDCKDNVNAIELQDNLWKINVDYSGNARSGGVERRDSDRRTGVERRDSNRRAHVERRDSARQVSDHKQNWNVERRDSGRQESSRKDVPRRRDSQNRSGEAKNEGLWVNALPFQAPKSNEERGEENVKRESRKESYDLRRSPRKGNLTRKESKNRNDKPSEHVRRKVSGSRERRERDGPTDDMENRNVRKEYVARDTRWDQDNSKNDRNFEDFLKYREKCEDNFSHIQNVNREVSADREVSRLDHIISYGKLNGNVDGEDQVEFGNFAQQVTSNQPLGKPVYDLNDNCRPKKLAITDFL